MCDDATKQEQGRGGWMAGLKDTSDFDTGYQYLGKHMHTQMDSTRNTVRFKYEPENDHDFPFQY